MTNAYTFLAVITALDPNVRLRHIGEAPIDCFPVQDGCATIIHENINIFGVSCYLPDYCGKETSVNKLSGNFLSSYNLCQRYNVPKTGDRYVFDYDFEANPPFSVSSIRQPIRDAEVYVEIVKWKNELRVRPMLAFNTHAVCNGRLAVQNLCDQQTNAYYYSRLPPQAYRYKIYKDEHAILRDMPFYFETFVRDARILYVPCPHSKGVLAFHLVPMVTITFGAFMQEPLLTITCGSDICRLSPWDVNYKLDAHVVITVNKGKYLFRYGEFTHQFKDKFLHAVITDKPLNSSTQDLLCGYVEPDFVFHETRIFPLNFTHYVKNYEISQYETDYLCVVPLPVIDDLFGFLKILHFMASMVTLVLRTLLNVLFSMIVALAGSFEQLFETAILILLELLGALFSVITELLRDNQSLRHLVFFGFFYFLMYVHVRDNAIVFPTIVVIAMVARVVRENPIL